MSVYLSRKTTKDTNILIGQQTLKDRLSVKGLTTRREMTKYDVCQYIDTKKGFNCMRIAITSNSKRDTLVEGLVCEGIKYL